MTLTISFHGTTRWKNLTSRFYLFLKIVEDVPDVDVVVVPVGGAGLIAGISCAVKTLKPECKVRWYS